MKNDVSFLNSLFIICVLTTSCAVMPQSTSVYKGNNNQQSDIDVAVVKKRLEDILKTTFVYNAGISFVSVPKEVLVSETEFRVIHKARKITITLSDIQDVNVRDWNRQNKLSKSGHYRYSVELQKTVFSWEDLKMAQNFADAVAFFKQKQLLKITKEIFDAFEPIAAQYRALKVKPPVPEEQRKYIVQANSMTQAKNYIEAINLYDKAIAVDQTNPVVYYNQALLFAQIRSYNSAINRMKKYLMLSPNALDARGAQDKIYEWEILMQK